MLVDITTRGLEITQLSVDEGRAIQGTFGGILDRSSRSIILPPRESIALAHYYQAETTPRFKAWLDREKSSQNVSQRLSAHLRDYQRHDMIRLMGEGRLGLWWGAGAGKTIAPLEHAKLAGRTLVIAAPLLVEDAYRPDWERWYKRSVRIVDTTNSTPDERRALLRSSGDLFMVSPYVLGAAVHEIIDQPWAGIFVDESSDMRNHETNMSKALMEISHCAPTRVCMSANPSPRGAMDLWPQVAFMTRSGEDNMGLLGTYGECKRRCKEDQKEIIRLVASISSYVGYDKYWPNRPQKITHPTRIEMDPLQEKLYRDMESDYRVRFRGNGKEITEIAVQRRTTQLMKLREITSGFIYHNRQAKLVGSAKINAIYHLLRTVCANKQCTIWCYFVEEYEMLRKALRRWKISHSMILGQGRESREELARWKAGKTRVMVTHPKTAGHGFRFDNSHLGIYFSLSYDVDAWLQSMLRHYRPPQKYDCHFYPLVCPGTIDEEIWKVLNGLAKWNEIYTSILGDK